MPCCINTENFDRPSGSLFHYGWVIVFASFVVGVCGYGTYFSFTLFYPQFVAEFGWSRTAISGAMSLALISYAACALPMGWCADRFGPRRTIVAGGLIFGLGTALGALVSEIWHLYALYGGVSALGMGVVWAPLVSTVSRWFIARRGLAVGIGSLGGGTGAFFIAPLTTLLIQTVGWRSAYVWLGLISGGLIVAAALLMYRDPEDKGHLAYGSVDKQRPGAQARPSGSQFTGLRSIARTWTFWHLALTFGFWWFGGAIVYVQIAPFILEKGFDIGVATMAVVAFGAGNGVGKIVMGQLCDRIGNHAAYHSAMAVAAFSMIALAFASDEMPALLLCGLFGFGFGGASVQITTISVDLFGVGSAGALMGAVLALIGLIGAGGPLLGGIVFDASGSYVNAYILGGVALLFSMTLLTTVARSP